MFVGMECPSSSTWTAYAAGISPGDERVRLTTHAAECPACREILARFAFVPTAEDSLPPIVGRGSTRAMLTAGTRVGRYVIEGALGAGGMGVVYAAQDPELDRRVAIKRLRTDVSSRRLQREAKALAKLDHPNVVRVHDVGELDGSSFLAMGLVEGRTLRQWAKDKRSPAEIVRAIVEAGRGLAAAHGAGLIHRDLKPDNIFVSDRGQVLVGDFGLATTPGETDIGDVLANADTGLTVAGTIVGTLAYIAPEQARGEPTVASDQFALCVTAWELLYGTRPFQGDTPEAVVAAIERGAPDVPADSEVPKRVQRALLRGLSADPAARWPSVEALLEELIAACERRSMWWLAAPALAAIGGVALLVARTGGPACAADGVRFAGVWDGERHAALAALGAGALETERTALDTALAATCKAESSGAVTHPQALERTSCLERRAFELDAFATQMIAGRPAKPVIDIALTQLPRLNCDEISAPVLPRNRKTIAALYARFVTTQLMLGGAPERVAALAQLEHDARDAGERELEARAAMSLGARQLESDDLKAADATLGRAYDRAIAIHSSSIAVGALGFRTQVASRRGDPRAAKSYAQLMVERTDQPGAQPYDRVRAYYALAVADIAIGDSRAAIDPLRKSLDLLAAGGRNTRPAQFEIRFALINALRYVHADGAEILKLARENAALARDVYGEHGTNYGAALNVVATALHYGGQNAEALASRKQALAIMAEQLPPDHSQILAVRESLADDLSASGDFEEARRELAAVLERAKAVGAAPDQRPEMLALLGVYTFETGRTEEGFRLYERGVEQLISQRGEDHPNALDSRYQLLVYELELRRFDDAARHADSLEASYRAQGDARGLAKLDGTVRAQLALARHHPRDAETLARRALASLGELHEVDDERANTLMQLATSLDDQHKWADALAVLDQAAAIGRARHYLADAFAAMDIQRARALAGQGHIAEARALAKSARASLDKFPGELVARAEVYALMAHLR